MGAESAQDVQSITIHSLKKQGSCHSRNDSSLNNEFVKSRFNTCGFQQASWRWFRQIDRPA